jgi:hypothetical protein
MWWTLAAFAAAMVLSLMQSAHVAQLCSTPMGCAVRVASLIRCEHAMVSMAAVNLLV